MIITNPGQSRLRQEILDRKKKTRHHQKGKKTEKAEPTGTWEHRNERQRPKAHRESEKDNQNKRGEGEPMQKISRLKRP